MYTKLRNWAKQTLCTQPDPTDTALRQADKQLSRNHGHAPKQSFNHVRHNTIPKPAQQTHRRTSLQPTRENSSPVQTTHGQQSIIGPCCYQHNLRANKLVSLQNQVRNKTCHKLTHVVQLTLQRHPQKIVLFVKSIHSPTWANNSLTAQVNKGTEQATPTL